MMDHILVIKLQAYNSLSSSNMRMLAMMKGLNELGYKMDLLCTPVSAVTTVNDMEDYAFLKDVTIITTSQNRMYERLVSSQEGAKEGLKQKLLPLLTEEEEHAYKLGRNHKVSGKPKRATAVEYHRATGMEAVFGYLHLNGRDERIRELFNALYTNI